jgi:hypothetical protein
MLMHERRSCNKNNSEGLCYTQPPLHTQINAICKIAFINVILFIAILQIAFICGIDMAASNEKCCFVDKKLLTKAVNF